MGTVLHQYPSSRNPAKKYNIIEGRDGVIYCDCMGWKMNKHCRHLDQYQNSLTKVGQTAKKLAKPDPEPTLDETIENIVNEIKYGG